MKKKVLAVITCVAMMAAGALATYAYFTDTDDATNTFTVGDVEILLDELDTDNDADESDITPNSNPARDTKNAYHLLPGHEYDKDPIVTVKGGSEACYVRMLLTINNQRELDEAFEGMGGRELTTFLSGYDSSEWILMSMVKDDAANTRTYEFWYKEKVQKAEENTKLTPLFTKVTIPGEITVGNTTYNIGNEEMDAFDGLELKVEAHAIQADGFKTADAAWAEF